MRLKKDIFSIIKKLEGLQTAESVAVVLRVKKNTALNYISKLRKKGFVENYSGGRKKRIYKISALKNALKGEEGLYDIVNKYSKIKVQEPHKQIIHGRKISIEESLVLAINSENFKLILASLNLFAHIRDWSLVNAMAKKYKIQRKVGALYDVARMFIKVRRMDKRIRKSMLKGKSGRYIYDKIKTKDFFEIVKKWRVEIPFKKQDLLRLKTG